MCNQAKIFLQDDQHVTNLHQNHWGLIFTERIKAKLLDLTFKSHYKLAQRNLIFQSPSHTTHSPATLIHLTIICWTVAKHYMYSW